MLLFFMANSCKPAQYCMRDTYQICQGIGVVKAGVAGWCYDICQIIGRKTEVWYMLKMAICVFEVHPVVLQPKASSHANTFVQFAQDQPRSSNFAHDLQSLQALTGFATRLQC